MIWWTYQQLRNRNPKSRLAAIEKLAAAGDRESVQPLMFALKDEKAEVRSAAAMALGKLGDREVVNGLVGLLRDADAGVRSSAARSLGKLGWQPADDAERMSLLVATGKMPQVSEFGASAIESLVETLKTGSPEKQLAAIKALGESDDPMVIVPLLEELKKDDALIRIAVLGVLERFGNPATFDAVADLLQDENPRVRAASMTTAAQCGGPKAVPALVKALEDSSWEVRHNAVKALGVLEDAAAVEGLCKVLKDSDHDVRESAARSLGRIGNAQAIYPLVLALVDPENSVRRMAEAALVQIDRSWDQSPEIHRAMPELNVALQSQEYWVRHCANKVLERLKLAQPEGKPKAAAAPNREPAPIVAPPPAEDVPAASAGVNAASQQRDAILLILTEMSQDPNPYLRLAAAEAFGNLHKDAALSSAS